MLLSLLLRRRHCHILAMNSVHVKLWDMYLSRIVAKDGKDVYEIMVFCARPQNYHPIMLMHSISSYTSYCRPYLYILPPISLYFIYFIPFFATTGGYAWICTSYACRDARLRAIRTTDACRDVRESWGGTGRLRTDPERPRPVRDGAAVRRHRLPHHDAAVRAECVPTRLGCGSERRSTSGRMKSGCEESYLRERAPRRDTGTRGVNAHGDSCGLRTRRCGQLRAQIGGIRGTSVRAGVRGSRPCVRVGGGLMTGGKPYDTLGMRETGAFEGRDAAANSGGVCARRCEGRCAVGVHRGDVSSWPARGDVRTEMGNDTRRPLLAHPTYNSSELTRAGVRVAVDAGSGRVAVEAEWTGVVARADGRALSNSSIGVAEWREKAACAGRGAWVRAEFGEGASLAMSA
ncbi:hypothetical protein C8R44DRAFT_905194 [Mycena epipterygia]|nr:hypothetical protein C8R44DRAFT_905194 [Mycena epipterygia]